MARLMKTVWLAVLMSAGTALVFGISATENDTFEDDTVMGWVEGGSSPNPPTNVATGGPAGAGDNYLENVSDGSGPGGKMVMFNTGQWTGDYNTIGSQFMINADFANFGSSTLNMRVAIDGPGGSYASTVAVDIPADGSWYPATFTLSAAEMTAVGGSSLTSTLANVTEFRVLHSASPSWRGDNVVGQLGMDNFRVVSVPVELQTFTVE